MDPNTPVSYHIGEESTSMGEGQTLKDEPVEQEETVSNITEIEEQITPRTEGNGDEQLLLKFSDSISHSIHASDPTQVGTEVGIRESATHAAVKGEQTELTDITPTDQRQLSDMTPSNQWVMDPQTQNALQQLASNSAVCVEVNSEGSSTDSIQVNQADLARLLQGVTNEGQIIIMNSTERDGTEVDIPGSISIGGSNRLFDLSRSIVESTGTQVGNRDLLRVGKALGTQGQQYEETEESFIEMGDEMIDDVAEELETSGDKSGVYGNLGLEFSVATPEEVDQIIQEYTEETMSRFVVAKKTKYYGATDLKFNCRRILWRGMPLRTDMRRQLQFDGVPFMHVAELSLHCQFGTDLNEAVKKRQAAKKLQDGQKSESSSPAPSRQRRQVVTKKCGCPVKMNIKQIIRFPKFKIDKDTEYKRKVGSVKLRQAMETGEDLEYEVRYVGRLPHVSEHKFHDLLEDTITREPVHHDLIAQIESMTFKGMNAVDIKQALEEFVAKEMFQNEEPPLKKRRKYYPSLVDIRNYMRRAQDLLRIGKAEKESLHELLEKITADHERINCVMDLDEQGKGNEDAYAVDQDGERFDQNKKAQTFFFCYQTPEQQRLMKRYGNLVFISQVSAAVYSSKLPLMYCLVVQTNVDYQVVGVCIASQTLERGLYRGLETMKQWNPTWTPRYVMVDYKKEDLNEIEAAFPDSSVYFTAHSCEDTWLLHIHKPVNDLIDHEDEIMRHLKSMAYSYTEDSLTLAAALLEGSSIWQQNTRFRLWFQTNWLHCAKQWVAGYRPDDLIITDHNHVTLPDALRQFKEAHTYSVRHKALSRLIEKVVTKILPESYDSYVRLNAEQYSMSRDIFNDNSDELRSVEGMPPFLLRHVVKTYQEVKSNSFKIASSQLGIFQVEVDNSIKKVSTLPAEIQIQNDNGSLVTDGSILRNANDQIIASALTELTPLHEGDSSSGPNSGMGARSSFIKIEGTDNKTNIPIATETATVSTEGIASEMYTVSFGDSTSMPFCTCFEWQKKKIPCLHMCAVFCNIPGWGWDMISPMYRSNNIFSTDYSCILQNIQDLPNGERRGRPPRDDFCVSDAAVQTELSLCESAEEILDEFDILQSQRIIKDVNEIKKESDILLAQCQDLLIHIDKLSFIFQKQNFHMKMKQELNDLVAELQKPKSCRKRPALQILPSDLPLSLQAKKLVLQQIQNQSALFPDTDDTSSSGFITPNMVVASARESEDSNELSQEIRNPASLKSAQVSNQPILWSSLSSELQSAIKESINAGSPRSFLVKKNIPSSFSSEDSVKINESVAAIDTGQNRISKDQKAASSLPLRSSNILPAIINRSESESKIPDDALSFSSTKVEKPAGTVVICPDGRVAVLQTEVLQQLSAGINTHSTSIPLRTNFSESPSESPADNLLPGNLTSSSLTSSPSSSAKSNLDEAGLDTGQRLSSDTQTTTLSM